MIKPDSDPILKRLRSALAETYGDRIDQVVLFGSRARGDATPESDYDVAVFLKALPDRWSELDRMADLRVRFLDETGAFFDAKPYASASYREASPLMHEIRHGCVLNAAVHPLSGEAHRSDRRRHHAWRCAP